MAVRDFAGIPNPFGQANTAISNARKGRITGQRAPSGGGGGTTIGSPSDVMNALRAEGKLKRQGGRGRRQNTRGGRKSR